jgi:hypothetical protein
MTRANLLTAFLLAATVVGCGPPKPNLPPPLPHGGLAFPLPEAKGFVEALRQDAPDQPGRTQLVIYFLDAECKPLASEPAAATFKPKGRGASPVVLKPLGNADPSKSGGLASAPFADPGEIVGELSVTIEGKPVSVPINIR